MDQKMTTLERAFQLASSGDFPGITEIVRSLKRDGYSTDQIQGQSLKRQLTALIRAARASAADPKTGEAGEAVQIPPKP